ncbi:MAG: hypothetical protein LBV54_02805 [Puniceicoccales bacterium]|nr:hypothetical protein [Puniceicoccales bacterium]
MPTTDIKNVNASRPLEKHPNAPTEADWKYFSSIREALLEKFSRRHCDRLRQILAQTDLSEDDKRHAIYKAVLEDDKDVARLFNGSRRSILDLQCMSLTAYGLLTPEHIARFSPGFQACLNEVRLIHFPPPVDPNLAFQKGQPHA